MNHGAFPFSLRTVRTRQFPLLITVNKHINLLVAFSAAVFVTLVCLAVYHMGVSASAGLQLSKEQARLESLKDAEAGLSVKLAQIQAPGRIEQEIAKSGLVLSVSPIYVSPSKALAQR